MAYVLATTAAFALIILVLVFVRGSGRLRRFRRFVEEFDGSTSAHDEYGLAEPIDSLFEEKKKWVGPSARIETDCAVRYLFDLHDEPEKPARRSAALARLSKRTGLPNFTLRERMPSTAAESTRPFGDRFELQGVRWEELPQPVRDEIRAEIGDNQRDGVRREWLLEVRSRGDLVLVSSRDRPLSYADEWRSLLRTLDHLCRASAADN